MEEVKIEEEKILNPQKIEEEEEEENNNNNIQEKEEKKNKKIEEEEEEENEGEEEELSIIKIAHICDSHCTPDGMYELEEFKELPWRLRFIQKTAKDQKHYPWEVYHKCLNKCITEKVHHICHAGDITNVGFDYELIENRKVLETHLFSKWHQKGKKIKDYFSIVPGNHYIPQNLNPDNFSKRYRDVMTDDENQNYPYLKVVGNIILVFMNSRFRPKTQKQMGKAEILPDQIETAMKLIEEETSKNQNQNKIFFKALVMHHNPIRRFFQFVENRLCFENENRKNVQKFISDVGFDLVMVGHSHLVYNKIVNFKNHSNPEIGIENLENLSENKNNGKKCLVVDAGCCTHVSGSIVSRTPSFNIYHIDNKKKVFLRFERFTYDEKTKKFNSKVLELGECGTKYPYCTKKKCQRKNKKKCGKNKK